MSETIERAGNKVSSLNRYVTCNISSASTTHQNHRYNSFKVVALFSVGWVDAAAELGFFVYKSRDVHPKWEIAALFLLLVTHLVTTVLDTFAMVCDYTFWLIKHIRPDPWPMQACSTIVLPSLLVSVRTHRLRELTTTSNKLNEIKYTSGSWSLPLCIIIFKTDRY